MTHARRFVFVLFGSLLLVPVATRADAPRGSNVAQFQTPAAERNVSVPESGTGSTRKRKRASGESIENLEQRIYFRERPDALGAASRAFHDRQLEVLLRSREKLVLQRRSRAIAMLEEFVREEPDSAVEMPDALLRLAELTWEDARARYLEAFAAWQKKSESTRGAAPTPDYRRAIELYDRILTKHRSFDRYDLVLYMKAFALVERDDTEGALMLYRRILREFPNSRFVPDAHFALAEAQFSAFAHAEALVEYERVLKYPDSELYDIALFKSAWCMWRLGRGREAAQRFREVLDLGRHRGQLSSSQRRRLKELQEEALGYLIQVFTEDERNTANDVFRFLQEIGGERYANRVLVRLSDTYMGQGRYDRAVDAYRLLLEMDPTVPEAPDYQLQIADAYANLNDGPKSLEALTALAANYGPKSKWASQQGDPEVVKRARARAEATIRKRALEAHQLGQKHNERARFEQAVLLYGIYLEHFPDAKAAYEIEFYRSEILFHRLERFDEAGEGYLRAARRKPDGEFSRDALYNAIGAFERVREKEIAACVSAAKGRSGGDATCAETENDRKFGAAIELYVQLFPNDPDIPEILFRQGRLYYDRGIYDPAVRLFGQLLERYPESQYAEPAGELILDSFNRAKDYQNIEKWARRLKTAPSFQKPEKQHRLDGLILQAMFKVGEQLAASEKHREAADAYYRAAEEFPRDGRAAKAYYNAGLEWQRAGDLGGAVKAFDRLVERHPGSEEGAKGAWAAAQMYESIAQFGDAARYYETYAEKFPKGEKRADALYNAVVLRVTAGDDAEAVKNGQKFLERYGKDDSADEVYFLIGRAHEAKGKHREAAETYRQYIRRTKNLDRKVEAQTRLGIVLLAAGDRREAQKAFDAAVEIGKKNAGALREGLYYAAQARYSQGDLVLAQYEEIRIAGEMRGLRERLQKKSELLRKASLIYADVVEFRVAEWVTASLYQIGRSFETFADGMREAPVPPGLSADEEQSYQDQLAMFIVPMEEKALEAYEGGYQKAIELRIFNRWTQKLREALTRLNDVQYPPLREVAGDTVRGAPLRQPKPLEALRARSAGESAPAAASKPSGGKS